MITKILIWMDIWSSFGRLLFFNRKNSIQDLVLDQVEARNLCSLFFGVKFDWSVSVLAVSAPHFVSNQICKWNRSDAIEIKSMPVNYLHFARCLCDFVTWWLRFGVPHNIIRTKDCTFSSASRGLVAFSFQLVFFSLFSSSCCYYSVFLFSTFLLWLRILTRTSLKYGSSIGLGFWRYRETIRATFSPECCGYFF